MTSESLLDKIAAFPRLAELLSWPFDFEITQPPPEVEWFRLKSGGEVQPIAADGTGAVFALCGAGNGENRSVLFVSSEGQSGIIAAALPEALQMIIALPYWRDCLKFSGGGDLAEMQKALSHLEREVHEDEPEMDEFREELFDGLGLTRPSAPLEHLHECVTNSLPEFQVLANDGSEYVSLFGAFVAENNPNWKEH